MSSDFNFNVASWFLGNVRVKPISTHSAPVATPLKLYNCSYFKQQVSRMQQYNTTNYQKWFPQNQQNYFCHNKPEKMSIWEMQGHIQFLESIETFWIVILLNAEKFLRIVTQLETILFSILKLILQVDLNLTSRYF